MERFRVGCDLKTPGFLASHPATKVPPGTHGGGVKTRSPTGVYYYVNVTHNLGGESKFLCSYVRMWRSSLFYKRLMVYII